MENPCPYKIRAAEKDPHLVNVKSVHLT